MVEDKSIENLKFQYSKSESGLVMQWLGESTMQFPQSQLNPYFDELVLALSEVKSFTLDFLNLEFMNSGTIQPIMYLIKGLNNLNIPIYVYYSKEKKWQALGFQVIKTVTQTLKNITLEAK